jgi:hypothetical protein
MALLALLRAKTVLEGWGRPPLPSIFCLLSPALYSHPFFFPVSTLALFSPPVCPIEWTIRRPAAPHTELPPGEA